MPLVARRGPRVDAGQDLEVQRPADDLRPVAHEEHALEPQPEPARRRRGVVRQPLVGVIQREHLLQVPPGVLRLRHPNGVNPPAVVADLHRVTGPRDDERAVLLVDPFHTGVVGVLEQLQRDGRGAVRELFELASHAGENRLPYPPAVAFNRGAEVVTSVAEQLLCGRSGLQLLASLSGLELRGLARRRVVVPAESLGQLAAAGDPVAPQGL